MITKRSTYNKGDWAKLYPNRINYEQERKARTKVRFSEVSIKRGLTVLCFRLNWPIGIHPFFFGVTWRMVMMINDYYLAK